MCVNDIIAVGAKPLFFLDYIAAGQLDLSTSSQIMDGIIQGCREAHCALLGGETAEMPGVYGAGDYELAGFAVGAVEKRKIIDGSAVTSNNVLIGLASNGIHSNGLSLARKSLFEMGGYAADALTSTLNSSIIDELLLPTRIYTSTVLGLIDRFEIRGIAHITGGGLYTNIKRIMPDDVDLRIFWKKIKSQPIFKLIQEAGKIDESEMRSTFNMGIGLCVVVSSEESDRVIAFLKSSGEQAYVIGETVHRRP
jgi:phosphoribosylformylglycinamidine cyclo-ligase